MTHQDDQYAAESSQDQPTMELLDGTDAAPPARKSLASRIARGTLYGVLLLSASALLAISAVPELASYASFIPDKMAGGTCPLSASKGSCTALDVAALKNIEGSPCCPLSSAMVNHSTGCSKSCDKSAALASVSAGESSCCQKSASSCCKEGGECPLAAAKLATSEESETTVDDALAKLPSADEFETSVEEAGPPAPPVAQ